MGKLVNINVRRLADWRALILAASLLALLLAQPFSSREADAAVANLGFETGDLFAWTTGATPEGVFVVGTDVINADEEVSQTPFEGEFMARLGSAHPSAATTQPPGPNELIQDFIIADPSVRLAYNIWTYDVTGFDSFSVELRLVFTDEVIYSHSEQAWGFPNDTSRKSTGWRVLNIPVSTQQQGQLARLTIRAGGTIDDQSAFWAYVDSAEAAVPPTLVDTSALEVNGHHPSIDPASGNLHITPTPASPPFHIEAPVLCPDGSTPDPVTAILGTSPPDDTPLMKGIDNAWSGHIPIPPEAVAGASWPLAFLMLCDGETVPVAIGTVTVIEPSGRVTDAKTGAPIPQASVSLQQMDDGSWITANPFAVADGGVSLNPQVNPQLAKADGRFGWDVVDGTYRVIVKATGYLGQISAPTTVPPPLSDLNVALVPLSATLTWWDIDCDGSVDSGDAMKIAQHVAGLVPAQEQGCSGLGSGDASPFGDVDCDGSVDSGDAMRIAQHVAGLMLILPPGCPPID